jgi:hypothetical protein
VQIENVSFDFADPKLERLVALTAADRKWMDDVVRTVEETWEQVSRSDDSDHPCDQANVHKPPSGPGGDRYTVS